MKGVSRDAYGLRAYVKVNGAQREKRFPFGTAAIDIQMWRDQTRVDLRAQQPQVPRGTVAGDFRRYLRLPSIQQLAEYKARISHARAWIALYGRWPRPKIRETQIRAARERWIGEGYAPKTINHRVRAYQHMCRTLDGAKVPTPCDAIKKLSEPAPDPKFVEPRRIRSVAVKLAPWPFEQAVFLVLTSTGQRPAQLKRTRMTDQDQDVDVRRRIWYVRPAKGGKPIPLFLNEDMVVAWKRLLKVRKPGDAPFAFDSSDYAKRLYAAGWPSHIPPYNAKHSVGLALAEAGVEWQDIQDYFGWKDGKMAKIYVGRVATRLKGVSDKLTGRLNWRTLRKGRAARSAS
jgi:hypothetical protein